MSYRTKRSTILASVGGLGAAGIIGLALAAGPAQAEPTPTPSSSSSTAAKPDRAAERAQRQDELATALATELGVDKAKVAAALTKVEATRQTGVKADRTADLETRLDAAVTAGTITADEAAAILKASRAGVLPAGGGRGGGAGR